MTPVPSELRGGWTRVRTAVHSWVEVSRLPPPSLWVLSLGPGPRKTDGGGGDGERDGQAGWGWQLGLGHSTPACPPCWAAGPPAG